MIRPISLVQCPLSYVQPPPSGQRGPDRPGLPPMVRLAVVRRARGSRRWRACRRRPRPAARCGGPRCTAGRPGPRTLGGRSPAPRTRAALHDVPARGILYTTAGGMTKAAAALLRQINRGGEIIKVYCYGDLEELQDSLLENHTLWFLLDCALAEKRRPSKKGRS